MPVPYNAPISQFVNPNSVEISEILKERYLQNYSAQDNLQQKLLELQTAPFAGDIAERNRLIQETNAQLEQFSSRGDYENLTIPIVNLARTASKKYAPLAQNYAAYEAAKQAEQERIARGDISNDQYTKWLERSKYTLDPTTQDYVPYQGVQFDDAGNAIQQSFYSHTPIARQVDVDKEILAALNVMEKEKSGGYVTSTYEADGTLAFYVQKEGQTIERISPQRVDAVTREVLNRSDVRSYLDQEADFNTFNLSNEELDLILSQKAQSNNPQVRTIARDNMSGNKRAALREIMNVEATSRYLNYGRQVVGPGSAYGGGITKKFDADFTEMLYGQAEPPAPALNPSTNGAPIAVPSSFSDGQKITQESLTQNLQTHTKAAVNSIATVRNSYGKVFDSLMEASGITNHQRARLDGNVPEAYTNVMMQVGKQLQQMTPEQLREHANKSNDPANALKYLQDAQSQFNRSYSIVRAGEEFNAQVRLDAGLTPNNLFSEALKTTATQHRDPLTGNYNPLSIDEYVETYGVQPITNSIYYARKVLGVDSAAIETELRQSLKSLGLDDAEIAEAIRNAKTEDANGTLSRGVDKDLLDYYEEARESATTKFQEALETYSGATLTMQEFNRAPGDRSKNGETSQKYVDQIKNQSTTTISGLSGKKDLSGQTVPEGKISNVRFTTAMLPDRTVVPAVSLSIQTGTNKYSTHVLQYGDVYGDKAGLQNYIVSPTTADILSEAYTYTYNNPASSSKGSPAIVTRHFTNGVLEAKFYPTIGDNNAFMGYEEVKTTFTRGDGNVIEQTLSLNDFLYQYNDLK
jgi:hypothetical protein